MKAQLTIAISLALALVPAASFAQELNWRAGGSSAPASGDIPVTISRPVPLNDQAPFSGDPASTTPRPIVRGQNADESKPLPLGPLVLIPGGQTDVGGTPLPSFVLGDTGQQNKDAPKKDTPKTMPKADGFVAPQPQAGAPQPQAGAPQSGAQPPIPVWGPPIGPAGPSGPGGLLGIHGDSGNPCCSNPCCGTVCCNPCCDPCGSSCWTGHFNLFGHKADTCCDPCADPCCKPRFWVYADYLLWVPQNQALPPLVTTSPFGTPLAVNGVPVGGALGQPTTAVAFDRFTDPARSGMRIGGGFWFTQDGVWGMDASYWFLAPASNTVAFGGSGDPQFWRPFISAAPALGGGGFVGPDAQEVAGNESAGVVSVHDNQVIWGAEINLRRRMLTSGASWIDLLIGYRHFSLTEDLDISENLTPVAAGVPTGNFLVSDRFHTTNSYNAPQVGIAGNWQFLPAWFLEGSFRLGAGSNYETVNVAGNTAINGVLYNGGLLALPTNIGTRTKNQFAVMPELNLKIGYDITPNLRAYVGYDFLFISSVVRPAEQIDLHVNLNQLPPNMPAQPVIPASPAPLFNTQSMWIQGVNFGLLYKF